MKEVNHIVYFSLHYSLITILKNEAVVLLTILSFVAYSIVFLFMLKYDITFILL
jgi:hypothetical protein